jgi:DNA repair protein RecN (Recombination protein N)
LPTGSREDLARVRGVLTDLRVRDLGVIEDLSLTFGPGMTALTGETGAGKTLVVEALQLLLGARANPGIVRAGATEALVEARFVIDAEGEGEAEEQRQRDARPAAGRKRGAGHGVIVLRAGPPPAHSPRGRPGPWCRS